MSQWLKQKKATLVLAGLSALMFVLMSHDLGSRGGNDVAVELLFKASAPAVRAGSSATSFATGIFKNYADLRGARTENVWLRETVLRLERERDALRDAAAAGVRLQELLGLKRATAQPTLPARVAGSGFASGQATLLIDRGRTDGVAVGMPVVAIGGVVGRVVLVSASLAKVQCLGDPMSGVGARLQDRGYLGAVVGETPTRCRLLHLPGYAEVLHGDLVVTSGLDRIYPAGIPIGRVVGMPEGAGTARTFDVRPGVDFLNTSEVLVLLTTEGGTPGDEPR